MTQRNAPRNTLIGGSLPAPKRSKPLGELNGGVCRAGGQTLTTRPCDEHGSGGLGETVNDCGDGRASDQRNESLQRALRDAEAQAHLMAECMPDCAVIMLDREGHVASWNEAAERITRYRATEIVGEHRSRFFPNEELEPGKLDQELVVAAAEGRFEGEGWRLRKDGSRFWAKVIIRALSDDAGELRGFAKLIRDVSGRMGSDEREGGEAEGSSRESPDATGRKRAEDELRASREMIEGIINAIPVRVFWKDKNLVYLGCNAAFACDAGFASSEDIIGKDDYEMGWRAQAELYRADDRQVIDSGSAKLLIEEPQTTPDGKTITLLTSKIPLRDSRGEISGVLGTYLDITEREQLHEELRRSQALLNATGRMAKVGGWELNVQAERLTWTDEVYRIHEVDEGFQPELSTAIEFYAAESKPLISEAVRRAVEQSERFDLELQIITAKGNHRCVHAVGEPQLHNGQVVAVAGSFQDITERKQAAEAVRRLQSQLAQSDRLSTMGTLAAGVAHEINNPLSYVLYNIQSLSEDMPKIAKAMRRCREALDSHVGPDAADQLLGAEREWFTSTMLDDVVERFGDAYSGTLRIKEIARGLGTFSRVERTEIVPVDAHQAIENAITMAFNEIKYRARLVKDLGQIPMVLASDGKLAQVFLNLLINAAHAIAEGHVADNEIRIRTWAETDGVFAEVTDTGHGIAPEHRSRIFEPFFSTKGVGVGTGLGLSICKTILEGFDGEISVASEPGKGTRFLIRLQSIPQDWEREEESQPTVVVRPKVRGRILVVDDEAGIRRGIMRMLRHDHEVVLASSGERGQEILREDRNFDLIFCDLMMPQMSGMELHSWVSEQDAELADQMVFITGGAFTPGAAEYLAKVGNLRVEKPFDAADFKRLTGELVLAARSKRRA